MEATGALTREQAREEMRATMEDMNHPHHQGWLEGNNSASAYLESVYSRVVDGDGPAPAARPDDLAGVGEIKVEGPDAERTQAILEPLRKEWGDRFEENYRGSQDAARELFAHPTDVDVFVNLGSRIRVNYGPAGEAAAVRFLAELNKIKRGA